MSDYKCEDCGLVAGDLLDGEDPDTIFVCNETGVTRCQGCALAEEPTT